MEKKFWIEQKVCDTTYRVNRGLPVQIIKIEDSIVQVWYTKGDDGLEIREWLPIRHIKAYQ